MFVFLNDVSDELGPPHPVRGLRAARRHRPRPNRPGSGILRLAASIHTRTISAYDAMRMLQAGGNPTQLGEALAHLGRVFKTLHV